MSSSTNPPAIRLAIVLSHPTQYYSPWFRWVSEHTDVDFRVFYLWEFGVTAQRDRLFETTFKWDIDLLSGYAYEFVPNTAADPGTHHFGGLRNPELIRRVASWNPSAVLLFGYNWRSHIRTLIWARKRGIPLLFRGDSHFLGRGPPPRLRRVLLGTLYRQFSAFLTVGEANADYFRTLGVPDRKLFRAPHSVDATRFDPSSAGHRIEAQRLREQFGIADQTRVVLFAGKLVPSKQPRELLEAYLAVAPTRTALVFVGDGPEKANLETIAQHSRRNDIHFLPFANQSEIPGRFLLADIFALPSRGHYETWGLAVNEAMHMGVPALVSDLVGCQRDLVTPGVTGWTFSPTHSRALLETLKTALASIATNEQREEFRRRVYQRIQGYTYAATTNGLVEALTFVRAQGAT